MKQGIKRQLPSHLYKKRKEKKKGKINLEKMIRFLFLAKPSIMYK